VHFSLVCAPGCGFADFVVRTCGLLVFNCWSTSSIVDCSIDSTISYSFNILPCFVIGNICGFTIYSTNKHWSC